MVEKEVEVADDVGDEGLLLGPDDVRAWEVESFGGGVRVVEVVLSPEYEEAYDVEARLSVNLVLKLWVFYSDFTPVRALMIVAPDVGMEAESFGELLVRVRETYGLTYPGLPFEVVVGTILPSDAVQIRQI